MKIKNLQINVLALLFGFAAFCFVNKIEANNATNSPEGQPFYDQNDDDVSGKDQKSPKRGAAALSWNFHGPIDVSGKVTSVVHNHSNPNIVYVGAAHNGVWKSTDGTVRWNKIPVEENKNLYVTCLALDPTSNALYAGTGGDFMGQGIYKAEGDGPLKLMSGTAGWANVYKIAVSGNKVYAATSEGLMCCVGGTWNVCNGTNEKGETVPLSGIVKNVSVNASGLVITTVNKADCYISKTGAVDGFKYIELEEYLSYSVNNISVAASPANNNVLYVVAARDDGKLYKAFLSEDKGDTWEVVLEYTTSGFIDPLEGNGQNINNIYADPVDPHTLYIASSNIWKGTRYAPGPYDFGLSAISMSDLPADDDYYLHSNVRSIDFIESVGDVFRYAYIATDGGIYRVYMYISPGVHITRTLPAHRFLPIGSYSHVCANNSEDILMGTPTLGVQAIDALTSHESSARYVWDPYDHNGKQNISEGIGGACAISLVNESFYVYSLSWSNYGLVFRRTVDRGISFQPLRQGGNLGTPGNAEWFTREMLPTTTPAPKYAAPMVMWENFNEEHTYDTVWFKANVNTNFDKGDRTIYASSKNFDYPIEYTVPYGFADGDSIQVPDPIQNRMFVGLNQKIFMTCEALNYEKIDYPNDNPPNPNQINWFALTPALDSRDSTAVFALSDNANTLYVGTKTGKVFAFTNLKNVHNKATVSLSKRTLATTFTSKIVRAMAVDPTDENHIVVVLNGGGDNVYETFNGLTEAATFNLIKGNLPNNVYSVLLPKGAKKGTIMVGTENGIWMKESGSTEWIANGLNGTPVMSLSQITTHRPGVKNVPYFDPDPAIGKIRINYPSNNKTYLTIHAGTYGSGIYSSTAYVGIDDISTDNSRESDALIVVPNPVTDIATIDLDMTKGQATIQIFSVDGRLMKEQNARNNANTINFKDYAPGAYIIQVIQGDNIKSAKVIKQ